MSPEFFGPIGNALGCGLVAFAVLRAHRGIGWAAAAVLVGLALGRALEPGFGGAVATAVAAGAGVAYAASPSRFSATVAAACAAIGIFEPAMFLRPAGVLDLAAYVAVLAVIAASAAATSAIAAAPVARRWPAMLPLLALHPAAPAGWVGATWLLPAPDGAGHVVEGLAAVASESVPAAVPALWFASFGALCLAVGLAVAGRHRAAWVGAGVSVLAAALAGAWTAAAAWDVAASAGPALRPPGSRSGTPLLATAHLSLAPTALRAAFATICIAAWTAPAAPSPRLDFDRVAIAAVGLFVAIALLLPSWRGTAAAAAEPAIGAAIAAALFVALARVSATGWLALVARGAQLAIVWLILGGATGFRVASALLP
ncbi:MAG: hypothetical protein H6747_13225 [Deltaproteobacteria bacterium]|nr:hypothetical protein [Deltaproteobacteria bacterium]